MKIMNFVKIGLILIAEYGKNNSINLNAIYRRAMGKYDWNLLSQIGPDDILFVSKGGDKIRVRIDGSLFFYKDFNENISYEELNAMWKELIVIKESLGLNCIYESTINISIFSKYPIAFFKKNKDEIEELSHSILNQFSLQVMSDEISALVMIRPQAEIIPSGTIF
jgi:hypothetical protein